MRCCSGYKNLSVSNYSKFTENEHVKTIFLVKTEVITNGLAIPSGIKQTFIYHLHCNPVSG